LAVLREDFRRLKLHLESVPATPVPAPPESIPPVPTSEQLGLF